MNSTDCGWLKAEQNMLVTLTLNTMTNSYNDDCWLQIATLFL